MAPRLSVIVAQGQSNNPAKRSLEEGLVMALMTEPGVDVIVVPHLYDISTNSTSHLALQSLSGNVVVLSWLYERAAHWILDRFGLRGRFGIVQLKSESDDDDDETEAQAGDIDEALASTTRTGQPIPNRFKYCIDLRVSERREEFVEEVRRIRDINRTQVISNGSLSGSLPIVNSSVGSANGNGHMPVQEATPTHVSSQGENRIKRIDEEAQRRWYPVIDFSRCTNCMECIDFCLFGVYGVDPLENILVEQPDNCRKGCPACSRVCPENAIMFPQHKTPAIAGANEAAESMKIDLTQLFGGPAEPKDALRVAAAERDEQLLLAGREAVGLRVGIPKRQTEKTIEPRDRLDDLVDRLDELDL